MNVAAYFLIFTFQQSFSSIDWMLTSLDLQSGEQKILNMTNSVYVQIIKVLRLHLCACVCVRARERAGVCLFKHKHIMKILFSL